MPETLQNKLNEYYETALKMDQDLTGLNYMAKYMEYHKKAEKGCLDSMGIIYFIAQIQESNNG